MSSTAGAQRGDPPRRPHAALAVVTLQCIPEILQYHQECKDSVGPELGKPTRVEAHACSGRQTAHGRGVLCRRRVSESLAGNRSLLGPCLDHLGKPMKRALRFEKNYINSEDRARTAEAGRQGVSMTDSLALSEASAVGPERPGCV